MVGVGGSEGKWKGDLGDGNKDGREGAIVGGGGVPSNVRRRGIPRSFLAFQLQGTSQEQAREPKTTTTIHPNH